MRCWPCQRGPLDLNLCRRVCCVECTSGCLPPSKGQPLHQPRLSLHVVVCTHADVAAFHLGRRARIVRWPLRLLDCSLARLLQYGMLSADVASSVATVTSDFCINPSDNLIQVGHQTLRTWSLLTTCMQAAKLHSDPVNFIFKCGQNATVRGCNPFPVNDIRDGVRMHLWHAPCLNSSRSSH